MNLVQRPPRKGKKTMNVQTAPARRRRSQAGFTLIDLLFVVALIGLLSAIAVPGLMRTRGMAQSSSAMATLRTINSGQLSFAISCGYGFYAADLPTLATPPPATLDGFVPPDVGAGFTVTKSGYLFSMAGFQVPGAPATCNGKAIGETSSGYAAIADPLNVTDVRFFATNTDGALWEHTASFGLVMPESGPSPVGYVITR
jgi:prepilin-type N-terminal cleavage/methylation domain-containing protein